MEQVWVRLYELAGYVGVDPDSYSLRQLAWMANERWKREWTHTSRWCALLANIHRDEQKRRRPFDPWDFLPEDLQAVIPKPAPQRVRFTPSDLHALKEAFE